MEHLIFTNARVVLRNTILEHHYVSVKNGVIESVVEGDPDQAMMDSCTVIDCNGNYLSPGFIDIHCHGGGGSDFMDGHMEDILKAARAHLKHGTTGICPTTLTSSDEELFTFLSPTRRPPQSQSTCHTFLESTWKVPISLPPRRARSRRSTWYSPARSITWKF